MRYFKKALSDSDFISSSIQHACQYKDLTSTAETEVLRSKFLVLIKFVFRIIAKTLEPNYTLLHFVEVFGSKF